MNTCKYLSLFGMVGMLGLSGCTKHSDYGEPMRLAKGDTVPLKEVLSDKESYDEKYVRVSGQVADVCQKKGCWMTMTDGVSNDTVFVKFTCPVEGRLIPMDAVGRMAVVEGTVEVTEITEEVARHYAEDSGASPDELQKIKGPQKQIRMAAPAARIEGI